jgi:hypothetical protein
MDPRYQKLADLLVRHSTKLEKGEHVLIEAFDIPVEMTIALIRAARAVGAHPHVAERSNRIVAELYRNDEAGLAVWGDNDLHRMKSMQAYIGIRGGHNVSEQTIVKGDQMKRAGDTRVQPATWFVSHTWANSILDTLDAVLLFFDRRDPQAPRYQIAAPGRRYRHVTGLAIAYLEKLLRETRGGRTPGLCDVFGDAGGKCAGRTKVFGYGACGRTARVAGLGRVAP